MISDSETIDLIKDNLVMFCDTFQAWLDRFCDELSQRQYSYHEKLRYADKMKEIFDCISHFNIHLIEGNRGVYQDLLSGIMTNFPSLALQADQVDDILDLIECVIVSQDKHITIKLKYNDDLKEIILSSIENMLLIVHRDIRYPDDEFPSDIKSEELL